MQKSRTTGPKRPVKTRTKVLPLTTTQFQLSQLGVMSGALNGGESMTVHFHLD